MEPKFPNIEVQLTGTDGNAMSVIGRVCNALRRNDVSADDIAEFTAEVTRGDYNHVLVTVMRWVEVS